MEIIAMNIIQKDYVNGEDFFLSGEVFIGLENMKCDGISDYEVYDFNVISIKRLYERFSDTEIMLNKGWMIMKYYDENEIRKKIDSIIRRCTVKSTEETYRNIASYFIMQDYI